MAELFTNKKTVFITTKNLDYIRNSQEIEILKKEASSLEVIGSSSRSYPKRLMSVWWKMLFFRFRDYESVFVGFAPQLVLPFFGKRMKRAGCSVTEDFFISLYDTFCFDRKKWTPESFMGKRLFNLDRKTLLIADRIWCDTGAHGDYFVSEFGADKEKIHVQYLEADKTIYDPSIADKITDKAETFNKIVPHKKLDPNKKIVLYFGSVLPLQGVETVLASMNKLVEDGRFTCIFIGPLDEETGKKFNVGKDNDLFHIKWLSQNDLATLIALSDICLAGHFNDTIMKAKRTVPGKAYIYEAMNKKMILGDNSATHEYFDGSPLAVFVPMGDPDAVYDAVVKEFF